jgi:DNA polymerase I
MSDQKHLYLVDGSAYIFRAYHRLPPLTNQHGEPVGAVYGYTTMLWKLADDLHQADGPTHMAVVLDKSSQSFRNRIYDQYKAHRPDPPEDLKPQFPMIRDATRAFSLPMIEEEDVEADDMIASYAKAACRAGWHVTIVSSDKDLMQLIRPGVAMYDPASGDQKKGSSRPERRIGEPEVVEYFGVLPNKVVDVQALAGDATDNVPDAPGIGIKTAAQLIGEYGDLDSLLARAGEIKQPKRRETLTDPAIAEQVRISRKLVSLVDDVEVETPLTDLGLAQPDPATLVAFLKAMEFTTITRRAAETWEVELSAVEADPALAAGGSRALELMAVFAEASGGEAPPLGASSRPWPRGASAATPAPDGTAKAESKAPGASSSATGPTPAALAAARGEAMRAIPFDTARYETVTALERLKAWVAMAREAGVVAVDTETNSLDAMQADLVGVSLSVEPGTACYIPLQHRGGSDLFGSGLHPGQLEVREALAVLKPLLEDISVLKVGQNLKFDWLVFAQHGVMLTPCDDTMLMSYVLDAGLHGHGMDELSKLHLGHTPIAYSDVAGSGKSAVTFDHVAIETASAYAAEDADVTLRLWQVLKPRLVAEGKATVYETLERPLVEVLGRMERHGIAIDRAILSRMSGEFAQRMAGMEEGIYEAAGERFMISSPKQLGDLLYGKMGLPGGKKTASGQWSTTAAVLEELAEEGHALPRMIVDWRQLAKLKSTYTDALPSYLHPVTGRVHTSFALAATTTGRLSSSEPNIQNIPVRTEAGRKIRTAFVAEPGNRLISADYSQIELRLLAHIADIPALKKAFAEGIDIHAMTASEMFGVPVKDMPSEVRRRAKAINFGIIYGISAFGLANQLAISREEAGQYIRTYFERFPGIRDYMDATKAWCREHASVTTIFGRVCHYPAIRSSNPSERAFVERQAINAPIQGSAADIIRRAMARMEPALAQAGLSARMLLQVHDELVFEAPEAEVEATLPVIRKVMADAPLPAVQLSVPLVVDAKAAHNWDEAH